jgi:hypothetical protein
MPSNLNLHRKMKRLTAFAFAAALAAVLVSCSPHEDTPRLEHMEGQPPFEAAAHTTSLGESSLPTLAEIDADPYTDLLPVPPGYPLQKQGIWSYSAAFLLKHLATGDTIAEVYHNALLNAGQAQTCFLTWDGTDDVVCCDPDGNSCEEGIASDGSYFLIRCKN